VMAGASADNPIMLIIDGSALISGLFLPATGNWSIAGLGCGTGFFIKAGANNDGIHNGLPDAAIPFDPGPPVPDRGANVSLSNFTINGNQGNGYNGNSTSGDRRGITGQAWYCGINLMNLNNITMEKLVVVNTPAYHIRFSNVGDVRVAGCVLKSYGVNTDGLHFDGPANDITILNCDFTTGDDSIGLNCPEGHSGSISRVNVTSCKFNSVSLMRLYTFGGRGFRIDDVTVSHCRGNLYEGAFLIGTGNGSDPDSIASLTVSYCVIKGPTVLALAENFGRIALKNVTLVPSQSETIWVAPQASYICAFARPSPWNGGATYVGASLSFENCEIDRYGNINAPAVILANDSVIQNLIFNGFSIKNRGGSTAIPGLLDIGSGSVEELVLQSLDSSGIAAPVPANGYSNIGSVSGAGVLATGWGFPDDIMANGVPYISLSSGLASIKQAGVVHPYPG
jgi:Glycosyl hydrolases family 28